MPRSKIDDTAVALLPFVRKFTGSSGGGQWSFQLLCSTPACRREDHISTSRRGIQSERSREKASYGLAQKGWKLLENPVCPECAKGLKSPLVELEGLTVARAYHTLDQDSLRLQFSGSAELIAYNVSLINGIAIKISDSSCEFHKLVGAKVESVHQNANELGISMSGKSVVRIGLDQSSQLSPEAFQLVLPGYPIIVEQNQ